MTSEELLVLWMTYKAGPKAELDLAELILSQQISCEAN